MSEAPERLRDALAGRYRIERELGSGGMATVYLAYDLRHERNVALKVLRPELAAVLGAERFLREIRVTAKLQHPHILQLYDSGEVEGFLYYVMPYVEGESLRERLNREKQLPIEAALEITKAVAQALDYAHRHGVIHRDIKPENILLHDGQPVVADFGIALAVTAAGGGRLTETGLSLGTPYYMSPEQATADREVDARSDVYSLGCLLYEMLAGEPPFTGPTAQAVLGKVLAGHPTRPTEHRKTIPPHVEGAVLRALERLPADRFESADAMTRALSDPTFRHGKVVAPATAVAGRSPWVAALPWVTTVVLAATLAWILVNRGPADDAVRYVNIQLPDTAPLIFIGEAPGSIGQPALVLSPDGRRFVYVGPAGATTRLYVREIDGFEVRPLAGTEGAYSPCVAPDGDAIAFFADGFLKRVSLHDGQVVSLSEAHWVKGCSWSADDRIVTVAGDGRELLTVPATGGPAERRTARRRFGEWASYPQWLPGSDWLLAACVTPFELCLMSSETAEVRRLTVDGPPTQRTSDGIRGSNARFLAPEFLVFSHPSANAILAARFDVRNRSVVGQPIEMLQGVRRESAHGVLQAAVSASGDLLFAPGENAIEGRFVWASPDGRRERLPFDVRVYGHFKLSRNGRYLATRVYPPTGPDELWILDLERESEQRWRAPELGDRTLGFWAWQPDSEKLLVSLRGDTSMLLEVDARTAAGGRVLWQGRGTLTPSRIISDGRILMRVSPSGGGEDYLTLTGLDDVEGRQGPAEELLRPLPYIPERGVLVDASPDATWLGYSTTESGPYEVYAQRLQPGAEPVKISRGGELARFSPQGDGVYYRDGSRWYFVAFTGDPDEPFAPPTFVLEGDFQNVSGPEYEVSPDGERLLLLERTAARSTTTLALILNWRNELEERLAGR